MSNYIEPNNIEVAQREYLKNYKLKYSKKFILVIPLIFLIFLFALIRNNNWISSKNLSIDELQVKPDSLTDAIKVFLIGVAQGLIDGDHKKKKTRSMLIHPSVKIKLHQTWKNWVQGELERYKKAFDSKGRNILDKKSKSFLTV